MRERPPTPVKPAVRKTTLAVDVVVLSPRAEALAVLLVRSAPGGRERWSLPWDAPLAGRGHSRTPPSRITEAALGSTPALLEQVGAFADARRHPGDADVSVGVVALTPPTRIVAARRARNGSRSPRCHRLSPRHRAIVDRATTVVRQRVDQSPLAFRLLPPTFTLSDLQGDLRAPARAAASTRRASGAPCRPATSSSPPTSGGARAAAAPPSCSATPRESGAAPGAACGSTCSRKADARPILAS